ncbi:MAG: pyridine nucleotide-disulfide oxidoreductase [Candidatus Marinimicrobia bacterium]|nr:pyridine nucleotide-disulfide oxidoreductase [Candidatus Neomarinimicrobiota bacterium]
MADNKKIFFFFLIGAGPSGIAAVGKLLDHDIPAQKILWIDDKFKVGDLGSKWYNVSSNSTVRLFLDFLNECRAFKFDERIQHFQLERIDPHHTCKLINIVKPLQWISNHFSQQVTTYQGMVSRLAVNNRCWEITVDKHTFKATNVILAIGVEPNRLHHKDVKEIILEDALNYSKLKHCCDNVDSVAVFGSSHSAIIIIRYLVELGLSRIVNFYLSPLKFALPMGNWILFDNTGLKGTTADWARENILGKMPKNLCRYPATKQNILTYLAGCDRVIYAVGFHPNVIEVAGMLELQHNVHNGIIAPGLFGFGIAFPEQTTDPFGNREESVGLWKFMVHINSVLPIWLRYGP